MESARAATIDDLGPLEALARLALEQLRPLRGGLLWSLTLGRQEPVSAALHEALTDPLHQVVVGLIDDVVVGYGDVHLQGLPDGATLAVIDELYVEPDARGVGVGEAVMDVLLEWAGERGCVGIDAVAPRGDRATKNFFERFGLTARAIVVHRALRADGDGTDDG